MSEPEFVWRLTSHLCGACLGRVLERLEDDGRPLYRCSNCGVEGEGRQGLSHPSICACGSKLGKRDAGIRCIRNPRPRPSLPGEFLAAEVA